MSADAKPRHESNDIIAWFVPTEVPLGGAPDEVREQWVGTPLPIRFKNAKQLGGLSIGANVDSFEPSVRPNAVPVEIDDAILALELSGQDTAAGWWLRFKQDLNTNIFANTLSFRGEEGEVIAQEEVQQHLLLAEYFDDQKDS